MQSKLLSTTGILCLTLFAFSACKDDHYAIEEPSVGSESDTAFIKTIQFESEDGLLITADHYHSKNTATTIVLCHQAGWSRGEYREIAPKLNALGFNCLAIDQRSGSTVNGVTNETAIRALDEGKSTAYIDAKQDINAAIAKVKELYGNKVILWGSSYSSALALIVATENQDVEQVLSFSPGEYLGAVKVGESITTLNKPAFLASAKNERAQTKLLYDAIGSAEKTHFIPIGNGEHGSRALWEEKTDNAEYWEAVKAFLGVE
jgi:pimeloyl-ACP methyl ester carboxylesterase